MKYLILTEFKFSGIGNQEKKYSDFITLLQDFYDYFFDTYHYNLPESRIAYTATSLDSLASEMKISKSIYIETLEILFKQKFDIDSKQILSFKLIPYNDMKKYFPDIEKW